MYDPDDPTFGGRGSSEPEASKFLGFPGFDGCPDISNLTANGLYLFDLNGDGIISPVEAHIIIEGGPNPTASSALGDALLGGIGGFGSAAASVRASFSAAETVATQTAGQLVSANARAFLRGERSLSSLTAAERSQAIKGFEQAAQSAKNATDAAYQQARASAMRGERTPPGPITDWRKNFKQ